MSQEAMGVLAGSTGIPYDQVPCPAGPIMKLPNVLVVVVSVTLSWHIRRSWTCDEKRVSSYVHAIDISR